MNAPRNFVERTLRDCPSGVLFSDTGRPLETWCLSRGVRPMWLDVIHERARRKANSRGRARTRRR